MAQTSNSKSHETPFLAEYPGQTVKTAGLEGDLYSFKLLNTPRSARVLARWLGGFFVVMFGVLFLPWQQSIQGNGYITALHPAERPQTVNATIGGMIQKWHISEGQAVKRGDTILTLTEIKDKYFDPQTNLRIAEQADAKQEAIANIEQKIAALDQQIVQLEEALKFSLDKARNKVLQARMKITIDSAETANARIDFQTNQERFERAKKLKEQGLISLTDFESRNLKLQEVTAKLTAAENKLAASRNEFLNARIELNSIEADYGAKIAKGRSDRNEAAYSRNDAQASLAKLRNELANINIRNTFYVVRAPQAGVVVRAMKAGIGEMVKAGDEVATIVPEIHTKAVEFFVSPTDVPLLRVGNHVRLQFDGWPALQVSGWPHVKVGTFGGKVTVIDNLNSYGGKYRILIVPDEAGEHEEAWPKELRMGSGVWGWAMLDEVTVGYEIWRQLNGFPPSLQVKPGEKPDKKSPSETKSWNKKDKKGKTNEDEEDAE